MACTEEYLKLTEQWIKDRGSKISVLYQNGSFFEIYALKTKYKYIHKNSDTTNKHHMPDTNKPTHAT